jgi:hypothetical protein
MSSARSCAKSPKCQFRGQHLRRETGQQFRHPENSGAPHEPCRAAAFRLGFSAAADSCIAMSTTRALRADSLSTALLSRRPSSAWEKSTLPGARRPGRKTTTSPTPPCFLRGPPPPSSCLDNPQPMDAWQTCLVVNHLRESRQERQQSENIRSSKKPSARPNQKIYC